MSDLDTMLEANRVAVDELLAAAERCEPVWDRPRAPKKWSPAQIVEHVARSLEEGGNVIAERPSKLPSLPFFLRPLAGMFLRRIVRTGSFPKAKTNKAMNPIEGPATVDAGRERLRSGLQAFERECRAREAAGGRFRSPAFGALSVEEYAKFTELHTRHHTRQMPVS